MANAILDTLIFNGSIAGQMSIQSQPIGGNLTFQLPNLPPIQGQLITATAINGSTIVLGWVSPQAGGGLAVTGGASGSNFVLTTVTGFSVTNSTSGNIALTQSGSGNITLTGPNASSLVIASNGMLLTPGTSQATTIRAPKFSGQVLDTTNASAAHAGQVLASDNPAGSLVWSNAITLSSITATSADITMNASGGAIVVNDPLKLTQSIIVPAAGQDVAGVVTITAATSQAVVFNTAFVGTTAPVVVTTAITADPTAAGGVWIVNQGTSGNWTGFTIHVTNSVTASFNYIVIGS